MKHGPGDRRPQRPFEKLKASERLPSPSGVGVRILELTRGDDSSAEEIGRAIMSDSALTARLLRIANGAQVASIAPITTISDATMRLGPRAVRNVALGLSLISAHRTGVCSRFDYDRYWGGSLARAIAAQHLSRQVRVGSPAEAYVLGLLSEIGTLALASVYPDRYAELLASPRSEDPLEYSRREREAFDIDHGEVGAGLLQDWGFPASHSKAIQLHERPEGEDLRASAEVAGYVSVLRWSRVLCELFQLGREHDEPAAIARLNEKLERLREELALEPDTFHAFCNAVAREWIEWARMLHVPSQPVPDVSLLSERASAAASRAAHGETAPVAQPTKPAGLRILAVDDDPLSLKLLERHLVRAGHEVTCVGDGRQALAIALERNPQVVIADWMMPGFDGLDLCKALRRIESGRDMFFLLLTGRAEEDRVVEAFEAGVDDYVVKPFNPKLLMARLKGGQRVIELKDKVESDRQVMLRQVADLGLMARRLRTASQTDVLTELPNRRQALHRLGQEWDAAQRTGRPLAVVMIDVDHFKGVNDTLGHDVGDTVLKEVAGVLRATTRAGEEASRLGGEEFLVVCPNTGAEQALACAERIRAAIAAHRLPGRDLAVTASLGVAEKTAGMAGIDALLKAADDAVYRAKAAGRNAVRVWSGAEDEGTRGAA